MAGGFVRDKEATQAHVWHAVDLFKASTMDAVRSGITDHLVRRPRASQIQSMGPQAEVVHDRRLHAKT